MKKYLIAITLLSSISTLKATHSSLEDQDLPGNNMTFITQLPFDLEKYYQDVIKKLQEENAALKQQLANLQNTKENDDKLGTLRSILRSNVEKIERTREIRWNAGLDRYSPPVIPLLHELAPLQVAFDCQTIKCKNIILRDPDGFSFHMHKFLERLKEVDLKELARKLEPVKHWKEQHEREIFPLDKRVGDVAAALQVIDDAFPSGEFNPMNLDMQCLYDGNDRQVYARIKRETEIDFYVRTLFCITRYLEDQS